jgi:hypothetical protein
MPMVKDNLNLGYCFAPAHWRAKNAGFILIVVALIFLAASLGLRVPPIK